MSKIEGVKFASANIFSDDRGTFHAMMQGGEEFIPRIARIYVCKNWKRDRIRGFHQHLKEWKMFYVPQGAVKFVLVSGDTNKPVKDEGFYNPENRDIETYILSDETPKVLVVPPATWMGWMSLTDDAILIGASSKPFEPDPEKQDDYRLDPFAFGDVWSVKDR